jgi:hypothetical protein
MEKDYLSGLIKIGEQRQGIRHRVITSDSASELKTELPTTEIEPPTGKDALASAAAGRSLSAAVESVQFARDYLSEARRQLIIADRKGNQRTVNEIKGAITALVHVLEFYTEVSSEQPKGNDAT